MSTVAGGLGMVAAAGLGYTLLPHLWLRCLSGQVLRRGPAASGAVAFTFDDGPDPAVTPWVARALEQAGARGTFFVLVGRLQGHPELVRELVGRGHEVGLHGLRHRHLWTLGPAATRRQLEEGVRGLEAVTGRPVRYYRPPWGHFNGAVAAAARRLGLQMVLWSAAPRDWLPGIGRQRLERELLRALRPGAIIDLHDRGPAHRRHALWETLPRALEAARRQGLRAVTLSQLLGQHGG